MDSQITLKHILICCSFCLIGIVNTAAQEEQSFFDFLEGHDSLSMEVTTSMKQLLRKKDEYQKAELKWKSGEEEVLTLTGEIRTRGNARKDLCFMPPTKLRVSKDFLKDRGFSTYPTLKVVNTCNGSAGQGYVKSEEMIYDLYRLFTPRSFRTIPVNITYHDIEGRRKDMSFIGFLIEHEDQLADRSAGSIYQADLFKEKMLEPVSYKLFSMFQYMIGNTDWKVLNKHNLKILRIPEEKAVHAVAYDFDYAGLVNTHYAVPHESLAIKSVRERLYMGPCLSEEELPDFLREFTDRKQAIYQVLDEAGLDSRAYRSSLAYLDEFFVVVENQRRAKQVFVRCGN